MFSNFTEETCTGTDVTMTLLGATAFPARPFSRGFVDGQLVEYTIIDTTGGITCSGIGVYNSAGNTITRNDTENDDGTTTDKNPSTNITLSGGTHIIRCDVIDKNMGIATKSLMGLSGQALPINSCSQNSNVYGGFGTGNIWYMPFYHRIGANYTAIGTSIATAAASSNVRIGIYTVGDDGLPDSLVIDSGDISSAATGDVESTISLYLPVGRYWSAITTDDSAVDCYAGDARTQAGEAVLTETSGRQASSSSIYGAFTYGALPASAPAPTISNGSRAPFVYLR